MGTSAFWIVVECACRILGVSTAAVMCAVGVETLRQGEFHSLGVYLLVSAGGMLVFELSFFADVLLMWCLPCPPEWRLFVLWKKLAALGGFQKFLYYTLMSVVCFLHPVLLWHAVIPGTMLLVTGFAYFILSKKQTPPSPKEPTGASGGYEDASTVTTSASDAGGAEQTYSFRVVPGNRSWAASHFAGGGGKRAWKEDGAMATSGGGRGVGASEESPGKRDGGHVSFRDKALHVVPDRAPAQDDRDPDPEETTSDTAPMIRP